MRRFKQIDAESADTATRCGSTIREPGVKAAKLTKEKPLGRSRQRNKKPRFPIRKPAPKLSVKIDMESLTPQCPGGQREGLDGVVYVALTQLDSLVKDMRVGVPVPGIVDENTAVQRYLIYLSMLVDVVLADMAMSAVHCNDIAVQIKARILVEYANKAIYALNHPDHTLYITTIHEQESVLDRLRKGGGDDAVIAAAEANLVELRKRFAAVAHFKQRTSIGQMMKEHTRPGEPSNDEFVWLYGVPSALLHGDPEGMRVLMPVDEDGTQRLSILLEDDYLNALMVDAGSNVLIFCHTFIRKFKPNEKALDKRITELSIAFKNLSLKHFKGRPVELQKTLLDEIALEREHLASLN